MSTANAAGPMRLKIIIEGRKAYDVIRCRVPQEAEGFEFLEQTELPELGLEFSVIKLPNGDLRTSLVRTSDRIGAGIRCQKTVDYALRNMKKEALTAPVP